LTHPGVADASRDFALGQMAVADQPPMAIFGQFVSMRIEKTRNLCFNGLGEQGSCALPQHLGQRIAKLSWLSQLDDIIPAYRSFDGEVDAWTLP